MLEKHVAEGEETSLNKDLAGARGIQLSGGSI